MYKKILGLLALFFLLALFVKPVIALENKVNVYLFWSESCPHCIKEKEFLESLEDKYSNLEVKHFEVTKSRENAKLIRKVGEALSIDISHVPLTVIGNKTVTGFNTTDTTGVEIENYVLDAMEGEYVDVVGNLILEDEEDAQSKGSGGTDKIKVPILGILDVKTLSLPLLTLVIAALDGFNPCAMWALLFLISLLLGMKDRLRMWVLGVAFIAASGFMYFLFMSAWLNLFLFIGFIFWVRITIAVVALAAGGYYLRDYWVNKSGACKISEGKSRRKVFERLKKITKNRSFFVALVGIVLLAIAVNMVELVCSAGLPAVYTKVLTMANLPLWQYYLYLVFYVFIFMIDDLAVFIVAMVTLRAVGLENKYARYSRLIGGIVMLIIGLLLLVKPGFLMFG
jgi:thiol-disulfide isomerase/thioredoxin